MSEGKNMIVAIGDMANALGKLFFAVEDVASAAAELKGVCDSLSGDGQAEREAESLVIDAEAREEAG